MKKLYILVLASSAMQAFPPQDIIRHSMQVVPAIEAAYTHAETKIVVPPTESGKKPYINYSFKADDLGNIVVVTRNAIRSLITGN